MSIAVQAFVPRFGIWGGPWTVKGSRKQLLAKHGPMIDAKMLDKLERQAKSVETWSKWAPLLVVASFLGAYQADVASLSILQPYAAKAQEWIKTGLSLLAPTDLGARWVLNTAAGSIGAGVAGLIPKIRRSTLLKTTHQALDNTIKCVSSAPSTETLPKTEDPPHQKETA